MISFSSEQLQLSFLQRIMVPEAKTIEIMDSTVLMSTNDGIYYGIYNNVKKLTLNKNTICMLKRGGDLVTTSHSHISSQSQTIECTFQPSKVLAMRNYCLYYNPSGYFGHLNRTELKSHLLPCTLLRKPINCAGFIVDGSDIKTLLVTGHSIYQFKNGSNEFELENVLEYGIFGIVDGYSTWICITIINHEYCVVEISPDSLQVVHMTRLYLSDKLVFKNCFIVQDKLILLFSKSARLFSLNGELIQQVDFPNGLVMGAASPIIDKDNKLRFILGKCDKLYYDLELYSLEVFEHSSHSMVKHFKEYTVLVNYLLFGWVELADKEELSEPCLNSYISTLLSFNSNQNYISFHYQSLERCLHYYKENQFTIPAKLFKLFIFKKLSLFLLDSDLNPLFLQQCCTTANKDKLYREFIGPSTDFNFFKGCLFYFNSDPIDKDYALDICSQMLECLTNSIKNYKDSITQLPDYCVGTFVSNCLARGLMLIDSNLKHLNEFAYACGAYCLQVLSISMNQSFFDCFALVVKYYHLSDQVIILGDLLNDLPQSNCLELAIFYHNEPNYELCEWLLTKIDPALVYSTFTMRKSGELLCHFDYDSSLRSFCSLYPEISFLFHLKRKHYSKAQVDLLLAIEKYEAQNGVDMTHLRITSPKEMNFSLSSFFNYSVIISYLVLVRM